METDERPQTPAPLDEEHTHKRRKADKPPSSSYFTPIAPISLSNRPRPTLKDHRTVRTRQFTYNEVVELIGMACDEVKAGYHRAGVDPTLSPRFDLAWVRICLANYHSTHPQ